MTGPPRFLLPLGLLIYALAIGAARLCYTPPAPLPIDAPIAEASALRAREVLVRLLGDSTPHATGSAANVAVRERLVQELRTLGIEPELERGVRCSRYGTCGNVTNVIGRSGGRANGPALLLSAHYDSVAAGPGAADDMSGVALALEIVRALRAGPPLDNPVVVLISDGEELGLLGAQLFADEHRYASEIGVAINLEARGSSGPSLMFETSRRNLELIRVLGRALSRPVTSSAFQSVYERMPNDSDFSVFKRRGIAGYNFAFIGSMANYHTSHDDLAQLDLRSLQHQGTSALECARALGNADLKRLGAGDDAVFFDVLGRGTVIWPARFTAPFAVLVAALLLGAIAVAIRRRTIRVAELALGLVAFALAIVAAGALGFAIGFFLRKIGAIPAPWIAHPYPALAACYVAGILAAALLGASVRSAPALYASVWLWFGAISVVQAVLVPGLAFVTLVPAAVAAFAAFGWFVIGKDLRLIPVIATVAPLAAAALVFMPVLILLYDAIGLAAPGAYTLLAALVATPLAPACTALTGRSRWMPPAVAAAAMLAAAIPAALASPFSGEVPQRLTLAFHQDAGASRARFLADTSWGPLPSAMRSIGFDFAPVDPHPWLGTLGNVAVGAPAASLEVAAPRLEAITESTRGSERRVRARFVSARGASIASIFVPSESAVTLLSFAGIDAIPRFQGPWRAYTFVGVPVEGIDVEIAVSGSARVRMTLSDVSAGLPPNARALLATRPANAVASQLGDVTIVSRSIEV